MIDPFNFLLHCNRLAARKSAQAELLREALSEDFEALVYPAIAVARAERGPIGLILHSILCDHPNPVLCMTLGDSIPVETIVLREFALEVLHQKLRVLATLFDADPVMTSIREILADVPRFELPPNLSISLLGGNPSLKPGIDAPTISDLHLRSLALARTLVDLGTWHQSLGNHEASVGAIQKAERVLRPVFESDQTYLGFYSEVLNSLGAAHFDAGNPGLARELAVRVGQLNADTKRGECAECREAVAVAGLLLSKVLADSNHLPDALCFAESVVKDFMVFYKSDPGRFEHQLPDVMANYVTILRRSGFYKRASLLAQESVQTVNNLVPYSADAFLPQYGKALGSMSESFVITGDLSSAMKAAGVSVVIFEELNSLRPGVFGINYCLSLIQLALASALFEGVKNSMNLLNKAICIAEEIASVRLQACFAKGCAYFYRASFRLQLQTWEEAHADASKAFEEFIKYSQLDSVHDLTLSACALLIKIESLECLGRYEQALELFGQLQMMQETLTWHYPDQHTVHLSRSFEVNARLHMALNRFEEAGASAFHALSRCQIWTGEKSLFIQGQEVSSARTFSRAAYYLGKKDLWQQYEHKANLLYAELEGKGLRMFPLPAMLPLTR